jgi:hypothetical protein
MLLASSSHSFTIVDRGTTRYKTTTTAKAPQKGKLMKKSLPRNRRPISRMNSGMGYPV